MSIMVDDVPSLTNQELWDCRERLRQAQALVATVRDAFLKILEDDGRIIASLTIEDEKERPA